MESEQSQNFNERLSQWVANQGFWFQVRYSMTGSGAKGTAVFHLLRLSARLLIFAALIAVGVWIYLAKRTDYKNFSVGFKNSLQSALSASEIQLGSFVRTQGQLEISRFACQGGSETFFTAMEARNIRCKMGFLDGVAGKWEPGTITLSRLDVDLRAGADDATSAQLLSKALFKQSEEISINSLEVTDATLRWGYSERTRGSIENSVLKIQRVGVGWKLSFKGGTFSQNWLRKLEIVSMVVVVDPDGIVFDKAEFRQRNGSVDLAGLKVLGGERPQVDGIAKIRSLGLDSAVPVALRSFVEGSISGDFKVSGSTNSSEGIGFAGLVTLDGQDTVSLRERLHLLKALSVVDYVRNYYRVDFREGSFRLKTGGGGLELTEVSLKDGDLFTLDGNLKVRLPTAEETKEAVGKTVGASSAPLFRTEDGEDEGITDKSGESSFTLRRAAQAGKGGVAEGAASSLFDRLGTGFEMRRLEEQAADRLSKTLRYQGEFLITLLPDAFERAPKLTQQFPVDPKTGRIPMRVPIEGNLYEITLRQAEDIYQQGAR
ncbi:hypothetical protein HQ447_12840 [bacterium]|nr:hypothetical protein [bacterium]